MLSGIQPLVEIHKLNTNKKVKIYGKLESFNPGGSIKDRVALHMINEAEKRGELSKDKIILEATSGNTGIGLALIAAAKGYKLCLPCLRQPVKKEKILKAMGAELYFTPANLGTDGAIEVALQYDASDPEKVFWNRPVVIIPIICGSIIMEPVKEIWQQPRER